MPSQKTKPFSKPEDILLDFPLEIRAIAEHLRALVMDLAPGAVEKAYPGWRAIGYHHPAAGYFCGIFPQESEVRLLFEWGVLLPDPAGILAGEARQVRYIPVMDTDALDRAAVAELVKAALALPESAAVKRQLVAARKKS